MSHFSPLISHFALFLLCYTVFAAPATEIIDNGRVSYEVLQIPVSSQQYAALGCRFLPAGWLRQITDNTDAHAYLRSQSIYDHPLLTFGLASEFYPPIPLTPDAENCIPRMLVPGIGILHNLKGRDPSFDTLPERLSNLPELLFPWQVEYTKNAEEQRIKYIQHANAPEAAYDLEVLLRFPNNANTLHLQYRLKNHHTTPIVTSFYLHPFIPQSGEIQNCWYRLSKDTTKTPLPTQYCEQVVYPQPDALGNTHLQYGNTTDHYGVFEIVAHQPLEKVVVWHSPEFHVFALEPFVKIALHPGQEMQWSFDIITTK